MFILLVRAFEYRGLVRLAFLKERIPFLSDLPLEKPPSVPLSVLLSNPNASASTAGEIDALEQHLWNTVGALTEEAMESSVGGLLAALRCLLNTLRHAQTFQERTATLIVSLLDPEKMVSSSQIRVVSLLCSVLSSDQFHRLFNVFCMHGLGTVLVERLVHFCQRTGSVLTVGTSASLTLRIHNSTAATITTCTTTTNNTPY